MYVLLADLLPVSAVGEGVLLCAGLVHPLQPERPLRDGFNARSCETDENAAVQGTHCGEATGKEDPVGVRFGFDSIAFGLRAKPLKLGDFASSGA
jgi:hypothetical protein